MALPGIQDACSLEGETSSIGLLLEIKHLTKPRIDSNHPEN